MASPCFRLLWYIDTMARNTIIKLNANRGSFSQVQGFVKEVLDKRRVGETVVSEMTMLLEALFYQIVSQVGDKGTELEMSSINKLGHTDIVLAFPGERFTLPGGDSLVDPDAKLIDSFSDKISCSYEGAYNIIRVSVYKNAWSFILPNLIAVLAAIIVGTVLGFTIDSSSRQVLSQEWIAPLEKLFTNAMLMIGAPMTLFSLLKNVTDVFIVAEAHSSPRKLVASAVASSFAAIVLALIMGFAFAQEVLTVSGVTDSVDIGFGSWSLASAIDEIIPSSIIQPFETISPIPMIAVALLIAASLKSIGKNFDLMKRGIDACYDLFSGILQIVMTAFPVACFLLFLDMLLADNGILTFLQLLYVAIIVCTSTLPLLALYALNLKAQDVPVLKFVKKAWPLVKENFVIGSVIDAVPYNTRYCVKNFGVSRERLQKELPILAQVSLDGNGFILMILAAIYVFLANCEVSWINIAVIAFIVLFLSFGAPNQPGSILIGMLVILTYLHSDVAITLALCFELFFGALQNILNVISSVTMVTANEYREKRQLENS